MSFETCITVFRPTLYVCGFAIISFWGWSFMSLTAPYSSLLSLFPSCSQLYACADNSEVALVQSFNFVSCFISGFGYWVSTSVFCCVSEPRKLSDLQCVRWASAVGNQPSWEWGQRRKCELVAQGLFVSSWLQSFSVFMLLGQGGSQSDWTKNMCSSWFTLSNVDPTMSMGFPIALFSFDLTNWKFLNGTLK